MNDSDSLKARVRKLGLYGLLDHFDELGNQDWVENLVTIEEVERKRRSLERRVRRAKLGHFKPMADFDWKWPKKIDRDQVEDILTLSFIADAGNVVLVGPNGVGKTTIAQNIAHQALLRGHTVLSVTASEMLADLASQDTSSALTRRLRRYTAPTLLVVDEIGYLSYDNRHGDLLFNVVSSRHEKRSIVLTTNRIFREWNEVFPNSSCVTALIDRLVHKAEIVSVEGESYRLREAKERTTIKQKARTSRKKPAKERGGSS